MRRLLFCTLYGLAQLHNPDTIAQKRQLPALLNSIRYNEDTLVFSVYLTPFWNALRYSHQKKVKILYLGDESGLLGYVREGLEKIFFPLFTDGGTGWVFPYGLVEASPPTGYFIQEWGSWEGARQSANPQNIPLGLSGVCISTYDSTAGFRLYSQKPIQRLALLSHTPTSWQILSNRMPPVHYEPEKTFYITLPIPVETLECIPHPVQHPATLHGILAENSSNGVIFYSLGLLENSLSYLSESPLLKTHLRQLAPDLVIIDIGTQDIINLSDLTELKPLLSKFVDSIQSALPSSGILLVSPQDFFYRYVPFSEGHTVAHMYAQVAMEKKIAFWDAYHICGGKGSMRSWRLMGWAAPDLVHLLPAGYRHKGEILGSALLWGYERYLRNALPSASDESLHLIRSSIQMPSKIPLTPQLFPVEVPPKSYLPTASPSSATPSSVTYHKVRPGETLSSIAQKYNTSVSTLMKLNHLRSSQIKAGQILKISQRQETASPPISRPTYHKVRPGETLSSIAQKYNTSVSTLMKLNHLQSSQIKAGQILKVSPSGASSASTFTKRHHIVREGESLWSIAQKYKTTPQKIQKINKLKSSTLHPGQKLLLP